MKRFLPLMAVAALAACGEPSDKLSDEDRETIIQVARKSLARFHPKPEPESKPEVQTEVKPTPKPEAQAEPKPELKEKS